MIRILAAALLAFSGSVVWAQQQYTISGSTVRIHAARPLEIAAEIARERFGVPVSYEDVKTVYPGDIVDETAPEARRRDPKALALGRRKGNVEVELPSTIGQGSQKREQAIQFLRAAIRDHLSRGNNGHFEILENQFGAAIVPRASRGKSGKTDPQSSPLDARITLPPAHMTAGECLRVIAQAVSLASGETVKTGLLPSNYVSQTAGVCEAANEPARDVLLRALYFSRIISFGSPGQPEPPRPAFVWHLLCGVASDDCTLSVTPAVQLQRSRFGGYELKEMSPPVQ